MVPECRINARQRMAELYEGFAFIMRKKYTIRKRITIILAVLCATVTMLAACGTDDQAVLKESQTNVEYKQDTTADFYEIITDEDDADEKDPEANDKDVETVIKEETEKEAENETKEETEEKGV